MLIIYMTIQPTEREVGTLLCLLTRTNVTNKSSSSCSERSNIVTYVLDMGTITQVK